MKAYYVCNFSNFYLFAKYITQIFLLKEKFNNDQKKFLQNNSFADLKDPQNCLNPR
jgi:hypothetical protein